MENVPHKNTGSKLIVYIKDIPKSAYDFVAKKSTLYFLFAFLYIIALLYIIYSALILKQPHNPNANATPIPPGIQSSNANVTPISLGITVLIIPPCAIFIFSGIIFNRITGRAIALALLCLFPTYALWNSLESIDTESKKYLPSVMTEQVNQDHNALTEVESKIQAVNKDLDKLDTHIRKSK